MGLGLVEQFMAAPAVVDRERESYPAYGDFLALPFFVLLFPAARFLLDRLVFEVLQNVQSTSAAFPRCLLD